MNEALIRTIIGKLEERAGKVTWPDVREALEEMAYVMAEALEEEDEDRLR